MDLCRNYSTGKNEDPDVLLTVEWRKYHDTRYKRSRNLEKLKNKKTFFQCS